MQLYNKPRFIMWVVLMIFGFTGCFNNNPNPVEPAGKKVFYFSYPAAIKYLDPAKTYNAGFSRVLTAICEPPFEFHHLKRPSELIPRTAEKIPQPVRYDRDGKVLDVSAPKELVDKVVYTIKLKPGISYQGPSLFRPQCIRGLHLAS